MTFDLGSSWGIEIPFTDIDEIDILLKIDSKNYNFCKLSQPFPSNNDGNQKKV